MSSLSIFDAGDSDGVIDLSVGLHGHGYPASRRAPVDPGGRVHREVLHRVRQGRRPAGLRPGQVARREARSHVSVLVVFAFFEVATSKSCIWSQTWCDFICSQSEALV